MRSPWTRRSLLALAAALALSKPAHSQEISFDEGVDRLTRTVRHTTNILSRIVARAAALTRPTDPQLLAGMRNDVRRVRDALGRLLRTQSTLFDHIDMYLDYARSPGATAEEARARWVTLNSQFSAVFIRVGTIADELRATRYLDDATDSDFVGDLQLVLQQRMGILAQLRQMDPPRTQSELASLERLADAYRVLHAQLREAVRELERTEARLI